MIRYLNYWHESSASRIIISSGLILVTALILAGGLVFWVSQSSFVFAASHSNQDQLEIARSGLETMKKMVGDKQIWSESIQEEYNKIFAASATKTSAVSYGDNYVGLNYPTN